MDFLKRFWVLAIGLLVLASGASSMGQEEKKNSGGMFRFNSAKSSAPKTSEKPAEKAGVKLGLSSAAATIPPELREIAQKGANAISKGDWMQARQLYQEMVYQAPDNPLALANLGVADYQLKNFQGAELSLQKALEIEPSISQNWTTLGLIQFEKGQLLLAISSLTRAVHEDPNSVPAHLYLAAVTYEFGWTQAAISELNEVIKLDPKNSEAHFNLAQTYLSLKPPRVELARRHYYVARDLGAAPSPKIEEMLRISTE
jgi:tetratricopeptide (TPR) repeat protein